MKKKSERSAPTYEKVIIVDRDNRPIDVVPRYKMRRDGLIHRATYILVLNHREQVFMQKRTMDKDFLPGYYDAAAGGVLQEGEEYDGSAYRELYEELGIRASLDTLFDFYYEVENQKVWGRAYVCFHEGPFSLQAEEIESGAFYAIDDILKGNISPITPDTLYVLKRYIDSERS
jgi:8-oxo-dGTP pyrophosphatase MutT (NUDIX family)